jgi:hypothetical protein
MTVHTVERKNWHVHLAGVIQKAKDGDTIICHSQPMIELAERARSRLCPEKKLIFKMED